MVGQYKSGLDLQTASEGHQLVRGKLLFGKLKIVITLSKKMELADDEPLYL